MPGGLKTGIKLILISLLNTLDNGIQFQNIQCNLTLLKMVAI